MIEMAAQPCELHDTFVENIIRRRKELGLRQAEVAELLGMARPSYSAIEGKRCVPSLSVVERVAKALQTEPLALFTKRELHEAAG